MEEVEDLFQVQELMEEEEELIKLQELIIMEQELYWTIATTLEVPATTLVLHHTRKEDGSVGKVQIPHRTMRQLNGRKLTTPNQTVNCQLHVPIRKQMTMKKPTSCLSC